MMIKRKYDQWKAITESDFVTLFIKTWFTYIASLRELNPDVNVFTAERLPRGDKPFLNAFKDGIMPIVQKQLPVETIAQELSQMYPVSMKKVIDVFPKYFFQTFFRINESFNFTNEATRIDSAGRFKEHYEAHLHIVDRYCLKFYLGVSGRFRTTSYNEKIRGEIDLHPIIESVICKHKDQNLYINDLQFMRGFYDGVMSEISGILQHYLDDTLPSKGYNQTVKGKIRDACLRLTTSLNVKFDYNYRYPHEIEISGEQNSYAIIYQLPFNGFSRIKLDNIYPAKEGVYSQLIATKGVDWFASYVYSLRNALFHEIISPLDEEWQTIFKSAYLVLKQISDICITTINRINEFSIAKDNAVFTYVKAHPNAVFSSLADSAELLDCSQITLTNWKIKHGKFILNGWFRAKLKLQTGTDNIQEIEKDVDFEVTLNDDFSIVHNSENSMDLISIDIKRNGIKVI